MSDLAVTLLIVSALFVGLPVLAYMIVKLGTFGYLKARQKFEEDNHQPKQGD